jgi:TolB protein
MEIYTISIDGENLTRLTANIFFDVYPVWSPDDNSIAFLSQRETDLDIYTINSDGSNERKLFDSGYHDADIDWVGNTIVFTSQSAIWKMNSNGTQPEQVTNPAEKGQWGNANLPIGDYDPRLSPDSSRIAFERLEDVSIPHGGYNIFTINSDGSGEKRLTDSGYSQGLPNWSHSGNQIVYMVAAINEEGKYDLYLMNSDGTDNRNITPDYFPADFLCHAPIFSQDDSKIIFIGQWWQQT